MFLLGLEGCGGGGCVIGFVDCFGGLSGWVGFCGFGVGCGVLVYCLFGFGWIIVLFLCLEILKGLLLFDISGFCEWYRI